VADGERAQAELYLGYLRPTSPFSYSIIYFQFDEF